MNRGVGDRAKRWWPAAVCALAGAVVFQFFGNASFGYIKSASLFWWWGFQWFNAESETEHGVVILMLSVWLLWRNLKKRARGDPSSAGYDVASGPIAPALAAMVGALALHAVGFAAQQARVSVVALLLFTWGVLRLGGGRRWGAAALFPLGFLLLAIPFNALDSAGFWLRLWVIKASAGLAHAAGINVFQNGTLLLAPDGRYSYDVAAACSGVRSLVALFALALLVGYLNFRSGWRRAAMVLLCLPHIYIGNVARIASIIFVANKAGQAWGERAHSVMGVGVFVIVLGGLLLGAEALQRWWPEAPRGRDAKIGDRRSQIGSERRQTDAEIEIGRSEIEQGSGHPGSEHDLRSPNSDLREARTWAVAGIISVLAICEILFLGRLASMPPRGQVGVKLAANGLDPVELPVFLGTEWIGRRTPVTEAERAVLPPDTGYSRKIYEAIANPAQGVFLSIVLSGRDRSSIHRPELCVIGQGWTIKGTTEHRFSTPGRAGGEFPATVLHVQREMRTPSGPVVIPQLIVYWFVGGDTIVATHWQRLMQDAWNRVAHARADRWAYVLMQTDARDGDAAALGRMQTVLNQTLPAFQSPPGSGK